MKKFLIKRHVFLLRLQEICCVLRVNEWYSKIQIVAVIIILSSMFNNRIESLANIALPMAITWLYMFCYLAFSYVFNTITDATEDQIAGKDRTYGLQYSTLYTISITIGFFQFLPLAFSNEMFIFVVLFLFSNLILSIAYSWAKLKTRGCSGLIAPALCQRAGPFILFILLSGGKFAKLDIFLLIWLILLGVHSIIFHQVIDFDNDIRSGISTFVVEIGIIKANILLYLLSGLIIVTSFIPFVILSAQPAIIVFLLLIAFGMKNIWKCFLFTSIGERL